MTRRDGIDGRAVSSARLVWIVALGIFAAVVVVGVGVAVGRRAGDEEIPARPVADLLTVEARPITDPAAGRWTFEAGSDQSEGGGVAVPVSALLAGDDGMPSVELIRSGDVLVSVAVTTGEMVSGWVEVDGVGVAPGVRVVVPS